MPFFGTHTDSTIFAYSPGQFVDTRTDSTFSRYSPRFSHFRYSQRFNLFSVLVGKVFRHSHGFYLFPVLTRIMPFFETHTDSTIFRYSPGEFVDTRTHSTFSRYSLGFCHFSILTQIRPFFDTLRDSFSTLARILPFPGTDPDYTIFWYSQRLDLFSILGGTVFRHSHGFYLFPV